MNLSSSRHSSLSVAVLFACAVSQHVLPTTGLGQDSNAGTERSEKGSGAAESNAESAAPETPQEPRRVTQQGADGGTVSEENSNESCIQWLADQLYKFCVPLFLIWLILVVATTYSIFAANRRWITLAAYLASLVPFSLLVLSLHYSPETVRNFLGRNVERVLLGIAVLAFAFATCWSICKKKYAHAIGFHLVSLLVVSFFVITLSFPTTPKLPVDPPIYGFVVFGLLALVAMVVAAFASSVIVSEKNRVLGAAIGFFFTAIVAVLLMVLVLAAGKLQHAHVVWVISVAVCGSVLGGITYVAISVVTSWRELHRTSTNDLTKEIEWLESQIQILQETQTAIWRANSEVKQQSDENVTWKDKDLEELIDELNQKLKDKRNERKEPDWSIVHPTIAWPWRLLRIPMAVGIAVGLALLGAMSGVDSLEPPKHGEVDQQQLAMVLGVFYLVGLYPRVFESLLKTIADRLAGTTQEEEKTRQINVEVQHVREGRDKDTGDKDTGDKDTGDKDTGDKDTGDKDK